MKLLFSISLFLFIVTIAAAQTEKDNFFPTTDDGTPLLLTAGDTVVGTHHTKHAEVFGKYVTGFNHYILQGIDVVQATQPDGGGYFASISADPPEAPIGYSIALFGKKLFDAQRITSYCSGSSYAAFIEALNIMYKESDKELQYPQYEALCMQEEDAGRREDGVKYWGKWNDDGFGNHFALVQYSGMGEVVQPVNARPGDFLNISWKKGGGHSVIFLGWYENEEGEKFVRYWSSQKGTNGLGDDMVPIDIIKEVMIVRLTNPDNLFTFDPGTEYSRDIPGMKIVW